MGLLNFLSSAPKDKKAGSPGKEKKEKEKHHAGKDKHAPKPAAEEDAPDVEVRAPTPPPEDKPAASEVSAAATSTVTPSASAVTPETQVSTSLPPSVSATTAPSTVHASESTTAPEPVPALPSSELLPAPARADDASTTIGSVDIEPPTPAIAEALSLVSIPESAVTAAPTVAETAQAGSVAAMPSISSLNDAASASASSAAPEVPAAIPEEHDEATHANETTPTESAAAVEDVSASEQHAPALSSPSTSPAAKEPNPKRFSFRSLTSWAHTSSPTTPTAVPPPAVSPPAHAPVKTRVPTSGSGAHGHTGVLDAKQAGAGGALARRLTGRAERKDSERALAHALVVRQLIVGPAAVTSAGAPRARVAAVSPAELARVKGALLEPKAANALIGHLRMLNAAPGAGAGHRGDDERTHEPIRAVCLPFTEAEGNRRAFHRLGGAPAGVQGEADAALAATLTAQKPASAPGSAAPSFKRRSISASSTHSLTEVVSVFTASAASMASTFQDIKLVDLVADGSFGIGEPGNGKGIFAGAIPTAETVVRGVVSITPQLLSLGYATGKELMPDHSHVYPPTDRMSVLTYWWGLELVLPEPSIEFLGHAPSIAHAIINFLTALSIANNGVREVLPFVRYISQYVDFEWNTIKDMDQGKGVVCAATWIMPAALVPRPWDFPPPPPKADPAPAPAPAQPEATAATAQAQASQPAPAESDKPALPQQSQAPTTPAAVVSTSAGPASVSVPAAPALAVSASAPTPIVTSPTPALPAITPMSPLPIPEPAAHTPAAA